LSDTPARSFTRLAIAIILAAVVISASVLSYSYFDATVTRTVTTGTTVTLTQMSTATVTATATSTSLATSTITTTTTVTTSDEVSTYAGSPGDLQLHLSMDPNDTYVGDTIQVNVSEFNTLSSTNNVTKSGDWQIQTALSSCPNTNVQPFGIALYRGYYTVQNVSQGTQLQIFPPTACPDYVRLITGYLFQPESDLATVLPGSGMTPMTGSVEIVNGTAVGGGQGMLLNPGSYTVVAADEWGALAFLHFQVNGLP
jgi:hypothetical protein